MSVRVLQCAASIALRDGGPAIGVRSINAALRRAGAEALVLTTDADGPRRRLTAAERSAAEDGEVAMHFCRRSRPNALKNSWSYAWHSLIHGRRADVMHIHGVYLANSVYAYLSARIHRRSFVVQPHGTYEPYQQTKSRVRKAVFDFVIGRRIVDRASFLVAASPMEAANLTARFPAARVEVVPLGVAEEGDFSASWDRVARWLSVPPEKRVIYLGRLANKKRPDLLVRAWSLLAGADAHLLVVGPSSDWSPAELQALMPASTARSTTFFGSASRSEAAWLLEMAGVFVLPSENENFGVALVEAMYRGCAVVATEQTASSAYVQRTSGGVILDSPTEQELGGALDSLVASPEKVREMGDRNREFARDHLSWDATAALLLRLYETAVAADSGRE